MFEETIRIVVLFQEIIITKVVLLGEKIRRIFLFQEMRVVLFEMIKSIVARGDNNLEISVEERIIKYIVFLEEVIIRRVVFYEDK